MVCNMRLRSFKLKIAKCSTILFILAYFRYFEKNKLGLRDHHVACVSV
jgi:hypothetical protein